MNKRKSERVDHVTEDDHMYHKLVQFVMDKTNAYMKLHDEIVYDSFYFVCHPTCKSLAKVIPELKCVDGSYLGSVAKEGNPFQRKLAACRHSWLETPDGAIIDVCPVGIKSGPILVIGKGKWEDFGRGQYVHDPETTRLVTNKYLWRKIRVHVRLMREAVSLTQRSEFVEFAMQ